MKTKITIKTILGKVLFEYESDGNNLINTLIQAIDSGADLRDADLSGADLSDADLRDADLRGADLRDADLRGADLSGADLSDAYLSGADLSGADLRDAYLRGADLRGADLSDADLSDADLSGAIQADEDLKNVKEDLFEVLSHLNGETENLLKSVREGKIDGSIYEGDCCCLVGTIANIKKCNYRDIPGITPDSFRPIEVFFRSIRPGHTPENSKKVKQINGWIEEFINTK